MPKFGHFLLFFLQILLLIPSCDNANFFEDAFDDIDLTPGPSSGFYNSHPRDFYGRNVPTFGPVSDKPGPTIFMDEPIGDMEPIMGEGGGRRRFGRIKDFLGGRMGSWRGFWDRRFGRGGGGGSDAPNSGSGGPFTVFQNNNDDLLYSPEMFGENRQPRRPSIFGRMQNGWNRFKKAATRPLNAMKNGFRRMGRAARNLGRRAWPFGGGRGGRRMSAGSDIMFDNKWFKRGGSFRGSGGSIGSAGSGKSIFHRFYKGR